MMVERVWWRGQEGQALGITIDVTTTMYEMR